MFWEELPSEHIILDDPKKEKNQFSYTLEPNFGTILIVSQPEVNMTVSLNGLNVGKTSLELKECFAGEYTVSALLYFTVIAEIAV